MNNANTVAFANAPFVWDTLFHVIFKWDFDSEKNKIGEVLEYIKIIY